MYLTDFRAMNSNIQMGADGSQELVQNGFMQARKLIEAHEQRFSRFSTDSELSRLNKAAEKSSDTWHEVSQPMFEVLWLAVELNRQTDGLFDPAVLPALRRAGYDRSMDEIRVNGPRSKEINSEPKHQPFSLVQLDSNRHKIWMPKGMQIDLGGIAKGWIAEQAARRLQLFSKVCVVNAGGDMFTIGQPENQPGWEIGIEDPLDEQKDIQTLIAQPGAIATSSITKRKWILNGKNQHHLIDPRTENPAESTWLSVTVFADHAAEAEVFAKALLIAGEKSAVELARNSKIRAFIAVDANKHLVEFMQPEIKKKNIYVQLTHA